MVVLFIEMGKGLCVYVWAQLFWETLVKETVS